MVWSNDARNFLVFPPGATTGARLVINKDGIIIYDANNEIIYYLSQLGQDTVPSGGVGFLYAPSLATIPGNIVFQGPVAGRADGDTGFAEIFVNSFDPDTNPRLGIGQGHSHPGAGSVERMVVFNPDFSTEIETLLVGTAATHTNLNGAKSWKFGAGTQGKYYYEEISFSGFNLPNNAQTVLVPQATNKLLSDYGTAWVGATWTAPADGVYSFCSAIGNVGGATFRVNHRILINGAITFAAPDITAVAVEQGFSAVGTKWLTAGDTVQASAFQNTAAAQILNAASMMSIRRGI